MSERSARNPIFSFDRAAIEDLLRRYFHGLDRCDPAQVRRVSPMMFGQIFITARR